MVPMPKLLSARSDNCSTFGREEKIMKDIMNNIDNNTDASIMSNIEGYKITVRIVHWICKIQG